VTSILNVETNNCSDSLVAATNTSSGNDTLRHELLLPANADLDWVYPRVFFSSGRASCTTCLTTEVHVEKKPHFLSSPSDPIASLSAEPLEQG